MDTLPAKLELPSGGVYTAADLALLIRMNEVQFVSHSDEPFTLKSGIKSHVYVRGREDLTDHPDLLWQVGRKICQVLTDELKGILADHKQVCLIGIPTAGTPFAQAASMVSLSEGFTIGHHTDDCGGKHGPMNICFRVMKEMTKQHGTHGGWINGKPNPFQHYILVDNVATNGASKPEAVAKLKEDGYFGGSDSWYQPHALIWIDRQQGAIQNLKAAGFGQITVVYNLLDITYAYGELGLWPKSAVAGIEEEIQAHSSLPAKI
jgi:orotate phosphoribosyltransferase